MEVIAERNINLHIAEQSLELISVSYMLTKQRTIISWMIPRYCSHIGLLIYLACHKTELTFSNPFFCLYLSSNKYVLFKDYF